MDVFIEDVDIQALVEEVLSIVEPLADKNGNRHRGRSARPTSARMRSDQTKVKQSLLNLLSNASKFTEQGHVDRSTVGARGRIARDQLRACRTPASA